MKTKIVYVLTCREDMTCAAMLALSLYTLRKRMKGDRDLEVLTVMDPLTFQVLKQCGSPILSESTPIVVDPPPGYDPMSLSRYLKTSLREIVQGDFLYIDCDTMIAGRLDEIDNLDANTDIAAVLDRNLEIRAEENDYAFEKCRKAGFLDLVNEIGFNGGVFFVRDTPVAHDFFRIWHDLWKKTLDRGVPYDQPALWETNRIMGHPIQRLSGVWNCQIAADNNGAAIYVRTVRILHYYSAYDGRILLSMLERIRKKGKVNFFDAVLLRWPQSLVYIRRFSMSFWETRAAFRKKLKK